MIQLPDVETLVLGLEHGWLHITLDQPARRNALSAAMIADLRAVLHAVRGDRSVRAITLRGAGESFCAGGDLKGFHHIFAKGTDGRDEARQLSQDAGEFFALLADMPQVTAALVHGPAMAGGFGLACACDVILATPDARFALTETRIGITPAQIAPYILRKVGVSAARRLMLLATNLDGVMGHDLGLVDYLVTDQAAMEAKVADLQSMLRPCAPAAVAVTKEIIAKATYCAPRDMIGEAAEAFAETLVGEEGREGISAFLEKRPPSWS